MFKVQRKMCATCIYRPDSPLNLAKLEADIADKYGGFTGYRVCHHSTDACCRGFWSKWKDHFQLGQVAQRLGFVESSMTIQSGIVEMPRIRSAVNG